MQPIIQVKKLSKAYRIGVQDETPDSLMSAAWSLIKAPWCNLRKLSRLNTCSANGDSSEDDMIWALKDVSFELAEGGVLGIIGRNGAGKSTLLKILSRITEPTSGEAAIRGRVSSLLEVGTGFHPELTGRENVYMNGTILGMTKCEIDRKFDEIVDFSGVEKFLDTPVKRYSSGMKVRLAFAVAAHLEPKVLIVDEVLAVGDAEFQGKCLGKMKDVAGNGRTVLFVSHNMAAVRELCTRALLFEGGQIAMEDNAPDVVEEYLRMSQIAPSTRLRLEDLPRVGSDGSRLRLLSVEFNSGDAIQHGEPLEAIIECAVNVSTRDVVVGFGFASLDGVRLISFDSDIHGPRINASPGRIAIRFRCDRLDLQPGRYRLQIGARSGQRSMLDLLSDGLEIEVLPGPNTPSVMIGQRSGVRVPSQWEWEEARRNVSGSTIHV